jgi:hypothetical protein
VARGACYAVRIVIRSLMIDAICKGWREELSRAGSISQVIARFEIMRQTISSILSLEQFPRWIGDTASKILPW